MIYFWLFTVIMNMVLFNIVLAIIMEAYASAAGSAENARSLLAQILLQARRWKETRKGLRITLSAINHAFHELETSEDASSGKPSVFDDDTPLTPQKLMSIIPGMPLHQAVRQLEACWDDYQAECKLERNVGLDDLHLEQVRLAESSEHQRENLQTNQAKILQLLEKLNADAEEAKRERTRLAEAVAKLTEAP